MNEYIVPGGAFPTVPLSSYANRRGLTLPLDPRSLPKRLPCSRVSYFHQADLPSQSLKELYSPHCVRDLILMVWKSLSNKKHEEQRNRPTYK